MFFFESHDGDSTLNQVPQRHKKTEVKFKKENKFPLLSGRFGFSGPNWYIEQLNYTFGLC